MFCCFVGLLLLFFFFLFFVFWGGGALALGRFRMHLYLNTVLVPIHIMLMITQENFGFNVGFYLLIVSSEQA